MIAAIESMPVDGAALDFNEVARIHLETRGISRNESALKTICDKHLVCAEREWMLSMATPWPMKHLGEPVTLSKNFEPVRSAYIFFSHAF